MGVPKVQTEPGAGSTWTIRGLAILKEIRCLNYIDLVLVAPKKLDLPRDVRHRLDLIIKVVSALQEICDP